MIKHTSMVNLELQARPELLEIVENLSKDKNISTEEVFVAMEFAIKKVAVNKYGSLYDIRSKINRSNGAIIIQKVLSVVENVENYYYEISLNDAKKINPDSVLGDELIDILPSPEFTRIDFQPFRQMILFKIREAEKDKEYNLYKEKEGEIVSATVKRVEMGNVFLELSNKAEAFLKRDMCLPRERLEVGDRIRAVIIDVKKDYKSPQIILSRTHESFIKKLFAQEISEVYEGIIEIKAISREAGSRSKVAVISKDQSVDPISTCIGFKGSRIQGILSELKGEKIDLVHYSDNIVNFVINAFYPSQVLKVVVDEEKHFLEVVLKLEALNLAIGRGGQNINLVSRLVGWHIDIMSEEAEREKRNLDSQKKISYFKEVLDVDEVIAQLLAIEGFASVEDLLHNDGSALKDIKEFNEDIVEEIIIRSKEYLEEKKKELVKKLADLNIDKSLINFFDNKEELLLLLANNGIKSLSDFADLSIFELLDIVPKSILDKKNAEELILKAREMLI